MGGEGKKGEGEGKILACVQDFLVESLGYIILTRGFFKRRRGFFRKENGKLNG